MDNFPSYREAKAQAEEWRKQYPNAQFRIEQAAFLNRVVWQVVQTNRFEGP